VLPRNLLSNLLNSLVEVEGIVLRCNSVRPKLTLSTQYCEQTGQYKTRLHRDNTSMEVGLEDATGTMLLPTNNALPPEDPDGNKLELEPGLCKYKDYQTVVLQDMPEKGKVGQLPRSIEMVLEYDLVDKVKPGDRIKAIGVYMPLASYQNNTTNGIFPTKLVCNNIAVTGRDIGGVILTGGDVKNIRKISSERTNILDLLSKSLCPSIFGHPMIKKALILQLLGGCERNLENGTHLRGDINVMMVGDPSTAKSQLLRAILDIAPLAISTTGRGSSGVGLTAAITMDHETKEKRLDAGAMVLADRGIVCIDEFDKMGENDRVAIHEVMEQQTVTIAKAGVHASLNARCSVIAAANPVYGQYDKTRRPQDNIGLPDSLLSRFDLLFIVLDTLDPSLDRILAEHILKSHQYRRPGTIMEPEPLNQASTLSLDENETSNTDTPVWLRGGTNRDVNAISTAHHSDLLSKEFLRKYIYFAKQKYKPVLSDEAMELISDSYAQMRAKQTQKNLPITARTLETLIRLSSANAKSRLSQSVDEVDVNVAVELANFCIFGEIGAEHNGEIDSSSNRSSINNNDNNDDNNGDDIFSGDGDNNMYGDNDSKNDNEQSNLKRQLDDEDDEEDDKRLSKFAKQVDKKSEGIVYSFHYKLINHYKLIIMFIII
jgi:DNA replication licensing factor MCM3